MGCGKSVPRELRVIPREEVSRHNRRSDCWCIIHGRVYDITDYLKRSLHPGGNRLLIDNAMGCDCSKAFDDAGHSSKAQLQLQKLIIGTLADDSVVPLPPPRVNGSAAATTALSTLAPTSSPSSSSSSSPSPHIQKSVAIVEDVRMQVVGKRWLGDDMFLLDLKPATAAAASPTAAMTAQPHENENSNDNDNSASGQVQHPRMPSVGHVMVEHKEVIRSYTPITCGDCDGSMRFLLKKYSSGVVSTFLSELKVSSIVALQSIRPPASSLPPPSPFLFLPSPTPQLSSHPTSAIQQHYNYSSLICVAAGTGLAPIYAFVRTLLLSSLRSSPSCSTASASFSPVSNKYISSSPLTPRATSTSSPPPPSTQRHFAHILIVVCQRSFVPLQQELEEWTNKDHWLHAHTDTEHAAVCVRVSLVYCLSKPTKIVAAPPTRLVRLRFSSEVLHDCFEHLQSQNQQQQLVEPPVSTTKINPTNNSKGNNEMASPVSGRRRMLCLVSGPDGFCDDLKEKLHVHHGFMDIDADTANAADTNNKHLFVF